MESYYNIKDKIEEIYEKKREGARTRSKFLWYKGKKSSKFFLNLKNVEVFKARLENLLQTTKKSRIRTKFRMNSYFSMKLFLEIRQQTLLRTVNVF